MALSLESGEWRHGKEESVLSKLGPRPRLVRGLSSIIHKLTHSGSTCMLLIVSQPIIAVYQRMLGTEYRTTRHRNTERRAERRETEYVVESPTEEYLQGSVHVKWVIDRSEVVNLKDEFDFDSRPVNYASSAIHMKD